VYLEGNHRYVQYYKYYIYTRSNALCIRRLSKVLKFIEGNDSHRLVPMWYDGVDDTYTGMIKIDAINVIVRKVATSCQIKVIWLFVIYVDTIHHRVQIGCALWSKKSNLTSPSGEKIFLNYNKSTRRHPNIVDETKLFLIGNLNRYE
jgi:hypothetical protein